LRQPVVVHAVAELKMLTQAEQERERYEARLKAQLDYNTLLKVARIEGRAEGLAEACAEGRAEGEKIGMIRLIHFCERFLKRSETPTEHLATLSLEELTRIADDLKEQTLKQP
jgi:hypothetical protein